MALRQALAAAPKPLPEMAGVPLAGGLVGYSSYDVVRYFERLPSRARADWRVPARAWDGVRRCDTYGASAPQPAQGFTIIPEPIELGTILAASWIAAIVAACIMWIRA